MTRSRLRKPTSKSIATVLKPSWARPVAMLALVVVLPTPPLPEVMTTTLDTMGLLWDCAFHSTVVPPHCQIFCLDFSLSRLRERVGVRASLARAERVGVRASLARADAHSGAALHWPSSNQICAALPRTAAGISSALMYASETATSSASSLW